MSVGEYIYGNLKNIIDYCNKNPNELMKLLDIEKSKELFNLNYSFFIETRDIDDNDPKKSSARYIAKIYLVNNKRVRVTNDWFERNIPYFNQYLSDRQIIPIGKNQSTGKNKTLLVKKQTLRKNSRYKGNPIGNSQNLLIRNILSNLGNESFDENDWENAKHYFNNKCAYCGKSGELVVEHAIPINKEKLGEHRIGNIVPACSGCNRKKGDKDYREFLGNNIEVIKKIDKYMESRNYIPLEDDIKLKYILNTAHKEVAVIAERYINIINDLFINNDEEELSNEQR
jgi:5-methylcytosine-specific restriction endonuclease McrA